MAVDEGLDLLTRELGFFSNTGAEGSFLLEERMYFCVLPIGFGSIQSH